MMGSLTKTFTVDVWTEKPISEGEIHKAYYLFRRENIDEPTELIMGVEACREFQRTVDIAKIASIDTYMGMKWYCDGEIGPKKWHVRRSSSKTYQLKEEL